MVVWIFLAFLPPQGHNAWSIRKLEFRDMFDILLEKRLSSIAGQANPMLYGKFHTEG
jgi:hypothetical protein